MVALTVGVGIVGSSTAAALVGPPAGSVTELAQAGDSGEPEAQSATGDGTWPLWILAAAMASLAAILATFTYWFWQATVPPARRGYSPPVVVPEAQSEHPAGPIGYTRAPASDGPDVADDLPKVGAQSDQTESGPELVEPAPDVDDVVGVSTVRSGVGE